MSSKRRRPPKDVSPQAVANRKKAGESLLELRKKNGWTQPELAEKLGVSVATLRRYEKGENNIRPKIAKKFAHLCHTDQYALKPCPMMTELNFYWRMGDYALEAVPNMLARFGDEPNETVDLVKYYQYQDRECKYSIGYFWYNDHEPCWELKFVGDRFKDLRKADLVALFEMLAAAYDTLEAWKNRKENSDG